jgi:hypothetical protein
VVVSLDALALCSYESQRGSTPLTGKVPFRFTAVLLDDENSPPPLGTWDGGQKTVENVSVPAGFVTLDPTMVVRPFAAPHTAYAVTDVSNAVALFMSTRQLFFPTGIVELMLTNVLFELENPPPPRILLVPGHVTCAVFCVPALFVTVAAWTE